MPEGHHSMRERASSLISVEVGKHFCGIGKQVEASMYKQIQTWRQEGNDHAFGERERRG